MVWDFMIPFVALQWEEDNTFERLQRMRLHFVRRCQLILNPFSITHNIIISYSARELSWEITILQREKKKETLFFIHFCLWWRHNTLSLSQNVYQVKKRTFSEKGDVVVGICVVIIIFTVIVIKKYRTIPAVHDELMRNFNRIIFSWISAAGPVRIVGIVQ